MNIDKLTEGKRVKYTSRANEGTAKVVATHTGKTGTWVTLYDKERRATVAVRPSQVSSR